MVILRFFVYVQFMFHFVLLALKCAHLDALQYWLGYICKCKASAQIHVLLFFHKDVTTTHLPHDISIHALQLYSKPRLNGQHLDQYSRWRHGTNSSGQQTYTMHHMCSYACSKSFQLWTLTLQKYKVSIGTNNYIYFPCRNKQVGNVQFNTLILSS